MRAPSSDLPIVFDDTSLRANDVAILDRVALALGSGQPTVLVGPNGAGKTSLIRLAANLAAPTSGQVTWGGKPETDGTRIAVVFQRPIMLRRSAAANVAYGLPRCPRGERRQRIDNLLARVGLMHVRDRPARRLSGGEQQRLALARALAKDPQILLLDEPTASLDPAATKAIEDVIRSVAARGIKVVMSTHDLGEARRLAGEIVLMHRGRVIESGAADTFFADPRTEEARRFMRGELLV
jgi:tungstate transport system ATP-binding protein